MTWETAKAAIDYSMKHSDKKLAVTFYGGEPLIKFDLLKQCVEYVKSVKGDKQISHSMTTNLVFMTREIAEYLASVDMFTVLCSLDGPKEIHDENRLTIDGKGSFDKAIQGLKYLVDAYKDRASTHLSLSMVMTLPATPEKLKRIQEFFDSLDWLPNDVVKNISYVSSTNHRDEKLLKKSKNASISKTVEYINPIVDWVNESIVFNNNMDSTKLFTSFFTQSTYLRVHKRMIVDEPVGHYNLSGCCIPASRRLYISTKGDFSLCEKIGTAPLIGNVKDGIDLNSVKKHYIDDFIEDAKHYCSDCWAIRLCGVCYVDCYEEERFNSEYKMVKCEAELFRAERALIDYHEVLERYPERLRYL